MIEAVLITSASFGAEAPYVLEGPEGWRGVKHYRVNTHDEVAAVRACPARGTPYSADLPECVLIAKTSRYLAKRDIEGTDPPEGGITIVRCDYQEPIAGSVAVPPEPGVKYTELLSGTETQTVFYEPFPTGPLPPLANGEGAAVKYGVITARVHAWIPKNSEPDLKRLIRLARRKMLNEDEVELPRVWGTGQTLRMDPYQVMYEGFSGPTARGNALEIVHELSLAPDFLFRWMIEDEQGLGVQEVQSLLYPADSFAGLW